MTANDETEEIVAYLQARVGELEGRLGSLATATGQVVELIHACLDTLGAPFRDPTIQATDFRAWLNEVDALAMQIRAN